MTRFEESALADYMYAGGIQNGAEIAGVVTKKFAGLMTKDGFSKLGTEIQKITDDALAHVINKLTAAGVERKYKNAFTAGFNKGLAAAYANTFSSRALRTK